MYIEKKINIDNAMCTTKFMRPLELVKSNSISANYNTTPYVFVCACVGDMCMAHIIIPHTYIHRIKQMAHFILERLLLLGNNNLLA